MAPHGTGTPFDPQPSHASSGSGNKSDYDLSIDKLKRIQRGGGTPDPTGQRFKLWGLALLLVTDSNLMYVIHNSSENKITDDLTRWLSSVGITDASVRSTCLDFLQRLSASPELVAEINKLRGLFRQYLYLQPEGYGGMGCPVPSESKSIMNIS